MPTPPPWPRGRVAPLRPPLVRLWCLARMMEVASAAEEAAAEAVAAHAAGASTSTRRSRARQELQVDGATLSRGSCGRAESMHAT